MLKKCLSLFRIPVKLLFFLPFLKNRKSPKFFFLCLLKENDNFAAYFILSIHLLNEKLMRGPASGETAARQRRAFDGAKKRTIAENRTDAKK